MVAAFLVLSSGKRFRSSWSRFGDIGRSIIQATISAYWSDRMEESGARFLIATNPARSMLLAIVRNLTTLDLSV